MKRTFENYLIMVGIRSADYTYTDEEIMDNTEYFKRCYNDNLSAYNALLFLHDYLHEVEARDDVALHIPLVVGQSEQLVCYICKKNSVEVEDDICINCAYE